MRNFTKFLSLIMAVMMLASAFAFTTGAKFSDVDAEDEILTKAVDLLASVGVTTGVSDTKFGTDENVTRQQMAAFIYRLMKAGKTVEGGDNITAFTDLTDPFYNFMISWASQTGVIKGTSDTTFNPKGNITLQDAYVMLVRALGYEKDEQLQYPYSYIDIAEDDKVGLNVGLTEGIGYKDALTRGDVAILLYNAFYADMADGTTAYRTNYREVDTGRTDSFGAPIIEYVNDGISTYTLYDTVADKIFGVKNVVLRAVATRNYSYAGETKLDNGNDERIKLAPLNPDHLDDGGVFDVITMEELGMADANSDDFFLLDFSIYYKVNDNGEKEILTVNTLGERMENIQKGQIRFETYANKYFEKDTTDALKKLFTGEVTIGGLKGYLFDAPWSYAKPDHVADKDKYNAKLLFLDATTRAADIGSDEYVQDFNFLPDLDCFGSPTVNGHPLYSAMGIWWYSGLEVHMTVSNPYLEMDIWDSNGDGKIDYIWTKPFTLGEIVDDNANTTYDRHATGDNRFMCYDDGTRKNTYKIYTAEANIVGDKNQPTELEKGSLAMVYLNGPANYIKVSKSQDLVIETVTMTGYSSGSNDIQLDGKNYGLFGLQHKFLGAPNFNATRTSRNTAIKGVGPWVNEFFCPAYEQRKNGEEQTYCIYWQGYTQHWLPANYCVDSKSREYQVEHKTKFDIAKFDGMLVFLAKNSTGRLDYENGYAVIQPTNDAGTEAITIHHEVIEGDEFVDYGYLLDVLVDGEIVSVPVKPVLVADGATKPATPAVGDEYNFAPYLGKLLKYTVDDNDRYRFEIEDLSVASNKAVLSGDDKNALYAVQNTEGSAFVKVSEGLYKFAKADGDAPSWNPCKYVRFNDDTIMYIKAEDEDGETVIHYFDSVDLPDFADDLILKNMKVIIKNNPNSTSVEDIMYFYAEIDGEVKGSIGADINIRFTKAEKATRNDEETIYTYTVYNPLTAEIEENVATYGEAQADLDAIYSITDKGEVVETKKMGTFVDYGKIADSTTKTSSTGIGLATIDSYEDDLGYLTVTDTEGEKLLFVDEETVINFLDDTKGTIVKADTDMLTTDAKSHLTNETTLTAFIVSSEIEDDDTCEHADLIVIVKTTITTP